MKKTLLLAAVLISSLGTFAQNKTYKYHFKGNLNELGGAGPALLQMCNSTFGSEALPAGVTKSVYRFNHGCGLIFNDAASFINAGTYTIELYFRLDSISGYKKLVDFDSLIQDAGLYNQNGRIVLYPNFTSADSFIGAGAWQYVAITRSASGKAMYINVNGRSAGRHTDNTDLYRLGSYKLLSFFRDDKVTTGEQSKGAVAMIQISNYALDSNTIKNNFTNLDRTLNVQGTAAAADEVLIYPNPSPGTLQVRVPADCSYSVGDATGRTVRSGELRQGDNQLALDGASAGFYLMKIAGADGGQRVYKFSIR